MAAKKARRIPFAIAGNVQTWGPFSNGKLVSIDADECSADIRHRAMLHGLKQKCGDSMAIEYKQPDGTTRAPTETEKYENILKVRDGLLNGSWSGAREATGGLLFRAFEILKPGRFADVPEFQEWLAEEAKAREITVRQFVLKLETQPGKIKDTVDQLRADAAGDTEIDAEDLLESM